MNTKDILLAGAGVVVGYLLVGYLNKSKKESSNVFVDQAKINNCNQYVQDKSQRFKFATKEAQDAFIKSTFEECMKKQQTLFQSQSFPASPKAQNNWDGWGAQNRWGGNYNCNQYAQEMLQTDKFTTKEAQDVIQSNFEKCMKKQQVVGIIQLQQ